MNFITELKHNTIFFSLFALLDFFVLCHSFLHWLIHPGDIFVLSVFQQLWIFSYSERWCIVCLKPKENELITFENSVIWEILWRCLNDQLDLLDRFGMSKSEASKSVGCLTRNFNRDFSCEGRYSFHFAPLRLPVMTSLNALKQM